MDWEWFKEDGMWIVVTVAGALLLLGILRLWGLRWIEPLIASITPGGEDWSRAVRITRRIILWLITLIILVAAVLAVLHFAGVEIDRVMEALKDAGIAIVDWLRKHAAQIALVIFAAYVAHRVLKSIIPPVVRRSVMHHDKRQISPRDLEELEQRAETLSHFLAGAVKAIIIIIAIFMILPELGLEIGPLLAGAGVIGIAIGFGAQNTIRDFLAGIFVIMEDQYGRDDVVTVAGITGTVEEVNIRRTVLRDLDGIVHVVPNGEITTASNYTKDWSRIKLDVSVGYGEDLDHVIEVINRVGKELAEDEDWKNFIINPPQVLRVNKFGDSGIDIRVLGETKPLRQWAIGGELRLRLKRVFDQEGIEIPWPHTKLYLGDKEVLDLAARYSGQKPVVVGDYQTGKEGRDAEVSDSGRVPWEGPTGPPGDDPGRDLPE
ncbi:MAG: mechanosensitive ion channel family protein [Dehalococcoidia bacterium]